MSRELLVDAANGEVRAALVEDGTPVDLVVEREDRASLIGNIYLGRVRRSAPAIAAAFVDIGGTRDGFLPLGQRRGLFADEPPPPPLPAEGEAVCVQVVRDASGGKGPQLSRRLSLAGCRLVYLPEGGRVAASRMIEDAAERDRLIALVEAVRQDEREGFVVRTAAEDATATEIARDAAYLRTLWAEVAATRAKAVPPALIHREPAAVERVLRDHALGDVDAVRIEGEVSLAAARAFAERFAPELSPRLGLHGGPAALFESTGVEEAIERALSPRVGLPSGGCVVFGTTEALTAVDVNSGSLTDFGGPADSSLRTNLEAADEIARQIRLRNIGGLIVIDFISMEDDASWERLMVAFAAGLASDRTRVTLMGRTPAGLVELTRRRRRIPLAEALSERCVLCHGTGHVPTGATVAHAVLRRMRREARNGPAGTLVVTAAPEVIAAIEAACEGGVDRLAGLLGRRIVLAAAPSAPREAVDIHVE